MSLQLRYPIEYLFRPYNVQVVLWKSAPVHLLAYLQNCDLILATFVRTLYLFCTSSDMYNVAGRKARMSVQDKEKNKLHSQPMNVQMIFTLHS